MRKWLVIFAIAAIAAGVSGQPGKGASKEQAARATRPQPESQNHNQDGQNTPSAVVQIGSQPTNAPDAGEEKDTQRKLAVYTFWLMIFTAVLSVVSAAQGYFLRQQANHLRTHAGHLENLATATRRQGEYLVASERAWIFVNKVALTAGAKDRPEGSKQMFVQCDAKNLGKTAARILGLKALWAYGPISDPGRTWDDALFNHDGQATPRWVVLPDKVTALNYPLPGLTAEPGQTVRAPLAEGEGSFIHGVIRYWDMFSETERMTRFCYRWENERGVGLPAGYYRAGGDRYNQQT